MRGRTVAHACDIRSVPTSFFHGYLALRFSDALPVVKASILIKMIGLEWRMVEKLVLTELPCHP